ncbi:MAG: RadC family protein [Acutalibacteraceae bacterium]
MTENSHIHDGHRNRMKEKFLKEGADAFHEHEILEVLLYYAVPRKDTNPLAHKLLERFGSLAAVLDAPAEVLQEFGLTRNAAVLLKLIPEISRVYMDSRTSNTGIVTEENIGERVLSKFVGRKNEIVVLMLLDGKGQELYCDVVSKGSVNSSEIYVRKLLELAVKYNASTAVLAHNHPSGMALPSGRDIATTRTVKQALKLVGVRLADHIIVTDDDYMSMVQVEDYFELFK